MDAKAILGLGKPDPAGHVKMSPNDLREAVYCYAYKTASFLKGEFRGFEGAIALEAAAGSDKDREAAWIAIDGGPNRSNTRFYGGPQAGQSESDGPSIVQSSVGT